MDVSLYMYVYMYSYTYIPCSVPGSNDTSIALGIHSIQILASIAPSLLGGTRAP